MSAADSDIHVRRSAFELRHSSDRSWRGRLVLLPPNRVWRTYRGGRTLDTLAGAANPTDSSFPEDWLASTTEAINPHQGAGLNSMVSSSTGVSPVTIRGTPVLPPAPEGISRVLIAGQLHDFRALLAADPEYFLGAAHVAKHGADPVVLVKLLDPSIRLHFQVHPTADFARSRLNAPSGKTEAYHVLATRSEVPDPCIFLGFHTPPARGDLRRWIETQDLVAIEQALNRVPVRPGDTYVVPGGVPHALGAGVFLVEIQEPSDLVVRFEFERAGCVLPESARFMNRGLDFALDVFDLSPWPSDRIERKLRCVARRHRNLGSCSHQDELIGIDQTPCFRVRRSTIDEPLTKTESEFHIVIVTDGAAIVHVGGDRHAVKRFDTFVVPAELGPIHFEPAPHLRTLECYPPA
jgi:mannose-6-phosphate isomerase